jgi:hypothetical protein
VSLSNGGLHEAKNPVTLECGSIARAAAGVRRKPRSGTAVTAFRRSHLPALGLGALCLWGACLRASASPEAKRDADATDPVAIATAVVNINQNAVAFDDESKTAVCLDCAQVKATGVGCAVRIRRFGDPNPLGAFRVNRAGDNDPERFREGASRLVPTIKAGHFRVLKEVELPEKTDSIRVPGTDITVSMSKNAITVQRPSGRKVHRLLV